MPKLNYKLLNYLPQNGKYFVSRDEYVQNLNNVIAQDNDGLPIVVTAVYGMGGVGKTELTIYYVNKIKNNYTFCYWFCAEDVDYLEKQFEIFYAKAMAIDKTPQNTTQDNNPIDQVVHWLGNNPGWLIVFDNAESFKKIERFLPKKSGTILITSRDKRWPGFPVEIDVMSENESFELVSKILIKGENKVIKDLLLSPREEERENIKKDILSLISKLDKLPLALEQAAVYLAKKSRITTVNQYIELFEKYYDVLLEDEQFINDKMLEMQSDSIIKIAIKPVIAVWNITFEHLKELQDGKEALELLHYCAYLPPDNISDALLRKLHLTTIVKFNDYDKLLRDYCLIGTNTDNSIKVHRLVQLIIRVRLRRQTREQGYIARLVEVIDEKYRMYRKCKMEDKKLLLLPIIPVLNYLSNILKESKEEENNSSLTAKILSLCSDVHLSYFSEVDIEKTFEIDQTENNTLKRYLPIIKTKITPVLHSMILNIRDLFNKTKTWDDKTRINLSISSNFLNLEEKKVLLDALQCALDVLEKDKQKSTKSYTELDFLLVKAHVGMLLKGMGDYQRSLTYIEAIYDDFCQNETIGRDNQILVMIHNSFGIDYREIARNDPEKKDAYFNKSIEYLNKAITVLKKHVPEHPQVDETSMELCLTYFYMGATNEAQRLYAKSMMRLAKTYCPENKNIFERIRDISSGIKIFEAYNIHGVNYVNGLYPPTGYRDSNFSIAKFFNSLLNYYQSSPVNFSTITGWRYPRIPRLTGGFLGRSLEITQDQGLFKEIETLNKLAKEHYRGMAYFWVSPTQCAILITRPDDVKQVMEFYDDTATRELPLSSFGQLLGSDNIFLSKGDQAKNKRGRLQRILFSEENLPKIQSVILSQIDRIANKPIDLSLFFTKLTMNVFSQVYLGTEELKDETALELSQCISAAFRASIDPKYIAGRHWSNFFSGKLFDDIRTIKERLKRKFQEKLLHPNKEKILASEEINIISLIIEELKKEFIDDQSDALNSEEIYSQVCTLLIAGHETTSITFQFVVRLLALHENREVLANLKKQLHQQLDGVTFTYDNIAKVDYLRMVIKETLRLYPPTYILSRGAEEKITLFDSLPNRIKNKKSFENFRKQAEINLDLTRDLQIFPGDLILISPYFMHRDETLWTDYPPLRFLPERHDCDPIKTIGPIQNDYRYMPFGQGQRSCIGYKFAERELMICLASLYLNYEVKIENANDMTLDASATLRPKSAAQLTIRLLSSNNQEKVVLKQDKNTTKTPNQDASNDATLYLKKKANFPDEINATINQIWLQAFSHWELLSEPSAIDKATKRSLVDKEKTDRSNNNLKNQANNFGFQCHNVAPDGNCFFNAVVDQLKRMDVAAYQAITSQQLREMAVQHLLDHFGSYKELIGEDYNFFMGKIMQAGEWADHIIIQALSRVLNVTFVIIRSDSADPTIVRRNDSARTIYLGYEVGWHYQSLVVDNTLIPPAKNISDFIQRADVDTFNAAVASTPSSMMPATSATSSSVTANTSTQASRAGKHGIFKGKVELPSQEEIQLNYAVAESRALGVTSNDDDDGDVQQQEDGKSFGSGN
jgi:cytochrome P450